MTDAAHVAGNLHSIDTELCVCVHLQLFLILKITAALISTICCVSHVHSWQFVLCLWHFGRVGMCSALCSYYFYQVLYVMWWMKYLLSIWWFYHDGLLIVLKTYYLS